MAYAPDNTISYCIAYMVNIRSLVLGTCHVEFKLDIYLFENKHSAVNKTILSALIYEPLKCSLVDCYKWKIYIYTSKSLSELNTIL